MHRQKESRTRFGENQLVTSSPDLSHYATAPYVLQLHPIAAVAIKTTAPALVHTDRIAVTFMPIAPLVSTIALKRADAAAPSSTPPRPGSPMSYSDDKEIGEISRNRTGKCR
ncbi:hypothetical protein GWI33_004404 [Rhynchophorus ferrugineus]|uniref:Uncharacterized protein n=1 Tax=Rhynchophorus ferrugineus TaxID=354439 RepID=A0A834IX87_RHYFE|nr:hypothetical protein GWI33_004404 [Rhynchophorus ferrugineus]